jgi:hypothetical protein
MFSVTDDSALMVYVRAALELDMPDQVNSRYGILDDTWEFRSIDAARYRVRTNATLDDKLRVADVNAGSAIVETTVTDFDGARPGLLFLSYDGVPGTGSIVLDVSLDATADHLTAGNWLHGDLGFTLTTGSELFVDHFAADGLSVKVTLTGNAVLTSFRVWLAFLGADDVAKDTEVIAAYAAARFWDDQAKRVASNGDQAYERYVGIARRERLDARGALTAPDVPKQSNTGGPVSLKNVIPNKYFDKLRG